MLNRRSGTERRARVHSLDGRSLRARLWVLLWESDMTPVKAIMCACAWLLALGSFASAGNCHYVACDYMEQVLPWYAWSLVWAAYASVKTWRILDGQHRPFMALGINGVGAFLFGGIATATTIARWPYVWLSAFEIVVAIASTWVLVRTTINPGHGFRGD